MNEAFLDLETFSPTPLKAGTHRYAEQAEILLFPYALGDAEPQCWDVTTGARMPDQLEDILLDERILCWFHNVMFDSTIIKHAMPDVFQRLTEQKRWRCTMVQALTHGMPGGLDILCEILGLAEKDRKLKTGKNLIHLFCKPIPFRHTRVAEDFPGATLKEKRAALKAWVAEAAQHWAGRATRHTHPVEWGQFVEYAKRDIPSMRAVHKKLPMWNYSGFELELWQLDQRINNRGIQVDVELAEAAIGAVERAQRRLARQAQDLSYGELQRTTQRNKLLEFLLAAHGVELPDLTKATIELRMQDPDIPWALKELLSNRLQASSSSTSKYKTLVNGVSADGRLRGLLQFSGAQRTKRWAGRLWQPQNLLRPSIGDLHDEELQAEIEFGIEAIKNNVEDLFYV